MKDTKYSKDSHLNHPKNAGVSKKNTMEKFLKTSWYSPNIYDDEASVLGLKKSDMRGMVELKTHAKSDKVHW